MFTHEEQEHERISKVFRAADIDNSGTVDYTEFKTLMKNIPGMGNISNYELTFMFANAADQDSDGDQDGESALSEFEFIRLCQGKLKAVLGREVLNNLEGQLGTKQIGYHTLLSEYVKGLFDKFDT